MEPSNESAMHYTNGTSIAQKLEQSRRDVLDLTLRNSLLNFRPSKRWGIEVVDELSAEISRILVEKQRTMYFIPAPEAISESRTDDEDKEIPSELLTLLGEPEVDSDGPADRHVDNKLQTLLERATLNRRLRETFRQARSSIEEQGRKHSLPRVGSPAMVRVREERIRAPLHLWFWFLCASTERTLDIASSFRGRKMRSRQTSRLRRSSRTTSMSAARTCQGG